jgi:hypothetical protein
MFGLPPREDTEGEEAARELLGTVGLSAVPDGNGDDEVDLSALVGDGETPAPEEAALHEEEEGVTSAAE